MRFSETFMKDLKQTYRRKYFHSVNQLVYIM